VASQAATAPKIARTCVKIGVTFDRTVVTSDKTTAMCEQTDKTFGRTKEPSVMTGNSFSRMNAQERVLGNCNRTAKTSGPTVKICEGIVET
jgi:hypothetical protein